MKISIIINLIKAKTILFLILILQVFQFIRNYKVLIKFLFKRKNEKYLSIIIIQTEKFPLHIQAYQKIHQHFLKIYKLHKIILIVILFTKIIMFIFHQDNKIMFHIH